MKKKQQNSLPSITRKPRKCSGKDANCAGNNITPQKNDMEVFPFPEITFDEMPDLDFGFEVIDMTYEPPELSDEDERMLTPAQKRFLAAYAKTPGNISNVATISGVPRRTVYNWLSTDNKFKEAFDDKKEYAYEFVMSKLLVAISKGSLSAIKFYLKTFAKDRGYR